MTAKMTGDLRSESGVVRLESLNAVETEILNLVGAQQPLALETLSDRINEVRHLISLCHLALSVAAYPWGVQFEIGLSKKGAAYIEHADGVLTDPAGGNLG